MVDDEERGGEALKYRLRTILTVQWPDGIEGLLPSSLTALELRDLVLNQLDLVGPVYEFLKRVRTELPDADEYLFYW